MSGSENYGLESSILRLQAWKAADLTERVELSVDQDICVFSSLSANFCELLFGLCRGLALEQSALSSGANITYRNSQSSFLSQIDVRLETALRQLFQPLFSHITRVAWNWDFDIMNDLSVVRYSPGQYYKEHIDAGDGLLCRMRQLSIVLYLNEDFVGGETSFRRQNVVVTPRRGKLLMFPSGFTHPHESLSVAEGTKYALIGWMARS